MNPPVKYGAIGACVMSVLIPLGFYFGGFDFDQRGGVAISCYIATIFFSAVAFGFIYDTTKP